MKTIQLGASGPEAPAVGFGCMRLEGLDKKTVAGMVHRALDLGLNFFDHADIYAGGRCEELFADSVGMAPALREKMILQSKCGIRQGFYDLSKKYILESVDGILRRLRTDYLDILLLHRPDTLMEPEEVAEALDSLHASGKARHFGVSNSNAAQIELLGKYLHRPLIVDQLQFGPAHTGMIDSGLNANMRNPASVDHDGGVLEYCRAHGIALQAWGPLSYGYFEGSILNNPKFTDLNRALERIGAEKGLTKAGAAIAWVVRHPAPIQPMIGFTEESQINEAAAAADAALSREEWYEIYRAAGNALP